MKTITTRHTNEQRHWVGDGFHVFPVFSHMAFTRELSPWLMFDYAAPKQFDPTSARHGVGRCGGQRVRRCGNTGTCTPCSRI